MISAGDAEECQALAGSKHCNLRSYTRVLPTPDELSLAYEVMPGNTSDKGTQMQFVKRLVKKYGNNGKLDSLWLMDRCVPPDETLSEMRTIGFKYLVGSPRSRVDALGAKLIGQEWTRVQDGIREVCRDEGTYLLRTNMTEADPAVHWKQYMIQGSEDRWQND